MPARKILVYPDKNLKKICKPAGPVCNNLKNIIIDMKDTFLVSPGCVGLAAPQIGINLRIILVDVSNSKRAQKKSSAHGCMLCVNPVIMGLLQKYRENF
ncbi:peptide deformylase [bacterium]|nr:peptide deformylase [bacterium]